MQFIHTLTIVHNCSANIRVSALRNSLLVLLLPCYVQLYVRNNFAEKEQNVQLKNKKTQLSLHRCLMCPILDGLVICLWLFFMLHLPLFGCSKIPSTLYWSGGHDVNRHTELAGIVSGSKCWHREGHFLHSHALPPQCRAVLAVSLLLLSTRLLYPQRSRPLFRKSPLFG